MSFTLRPYQQESSVRAVRFLRAPLHGKHGLLVLPTGCHAKGTEILMADGFVKRVEDVQLHELVLGPDSMPRRVMALCRGRQEMFRITPHRGGKPFVVNRDHVLSLISTSEGKKAVCPSHQRGGEQQFITVGEYLQKSKAWKHLRKLHRSGPVHFDHRDDSQLPLPGWMLGAILGDGSALNGDLSITTADPEIEREVEKFVGGWWMRIRRQTKPDNSAVALHLTKRTPVRDRRFPNPAVIALRALRLYGVGSADKFVPDEYRTASPRMRLEVLAGLLDTDGSHNGVGGYDFISKSPRLAADVAFLARSVGLAVSEAASRKSCQTGASGDYHRVSISGDTQIIPCRVKRKKAPRRLQKKNWLVSGFTVEPVGDGDFYGFTLSGDHLYLTADFTVHHNSGKSLVIADIVKNLDAPSLVLQPSREILQQNFTKLMHYGFRPAVYSASLGKKQISGAITLATIGSVVKKPELFSHIKYILVDECHLVSAKAGMYLRFFEALEHQGIRIIGLTATPYRLSSTPDGAILKFLTRTRPRLFSEVVYYVQNGLLFEQGHLATLQYHQIKGFDRSKLQANSTGADYTDESVRRAFKELDFAGKLVRVVERLLEINRRGVLVFTRFVDEAHALARRIPGATVVSAETPTPERDRILKEFKAGRIRVVANAAVLTTGFDYPELDTVVLARPTMSLALYYQCVGRAIRPHPSKEFAMIVDMVGLLDQFGRVEDLRIEPGPKKLYCVTSRGKQLTNVVFSNRR